MQRSDFRALFIIRIYMHIESGRARGCIAITERRKSRRHAYLYISA